MKTARFLENLFAITLFLILSQELHAKAIVSQNETPFIINEKRAKLIKDQMKTAKRLSNEKGELFPLSTWNIRWTLDLEKRLNLCHLRGVRVEIIINKIKPQWPNQIAMTEEEKRLWMDLLFRTSHSDDSQKSKYLTAADELENQLKDFEPEKSCEKLSDKVNQLGNKIVRERI